MKRVWAAAILGACLGCIAVLIGGDSLDKSLESRAIALEVRQLRQTNAELRLALAHLRSRGQREGRLLAEGTDTNSSSGSANVTSTNSSAAQEGQDPEEAAHAQEAAEIVSTVNSVSPMYQMVAIIALIFVVIFEVVHLRIAGVDLSAPEEPGVGSIEMPEILKQHGGFDLAGTWSLLSPYWLSQDGTRGLAFLSLAVILELAGIWVNKEFSALTSNYWNTIQYKEYHAFVVLLVGSIPLFVFAILVGTYAAYIRGVLGLHWRTSMTARLQDMWLRKQAFYRIRLLECSGVLDSLDNPDQRIKEDVDSFVSSTVELSFGLFRALGSFVVFLPMLLQLSPHHVFGLDWLVIPGWLCWITMAYALSGSVMLHLIGRELIRIGYVTQRREADFRSSLIRIREGAEAIALLEAEKCEQNRLVGLFKGIQRVLLEGMRTGLYMGIFNSFYFFTSDFFPLFALSPSYFAGHITLGVMNQARMAQGVVLRCMSWFLEVYPTLTAFRATCSRLQEFVAAVQQAAAFDTSGLHRVPCGDLDLTHLAFHGSVLLPSGKQLLKEVSLDVPGGSWAMITGASGAGKTTLLRTLVGLWPFSSGELKYPRQLAMVPADASVRLLKGTTLRETVCYPRQAGAFSDEAIEKALRLVLLNRLLSPAMPEVNETTSEIPSLPSDTPLLGYQTIQPSPQRSVPSSPLDRRDDWAVVLSSGERQRLEFAYLLCAQPQLIVLDEPTAHLPTAIALQLLDDLKKALPPTTAVVTVTHDPSLAACHSLRYHLEAGALTLRSDIPAQPQDHGAIS